MMHDWPNEVKQFCSKNEGIKIICQECYGDDGFY